MHSKIYYSEAVEPKDGTDFHVSADVSVHIGSLKAFWGELGKLVAAGSAGSRLCGARGIYCPWGPFAADLQHLPLQRVQEKQWGQKDKLSRGERGWQF